MTYSSASSWTSAATGSNVAVATGSDGAVCPGALSRGDVARVPAVVEAGGEVDGIHERTVH